MLNGLLLASDTDTAMQLALQALTANAQQSSANILIARIYLKQGNYADAEYHAKFVILQDPNNTQALTLLANIKLHKNWLFGLWWKVNNSLSNMSNLKSSLILVSAFLFFTLAAQVAKDLGFPASSQWITNGWLLFVIYTWVGLPYFRRAFNKELESFRFKGSY